MRTALSSAESRTAGTFGDWPDDPYAGFLPPNDPETHCGEGHLSYRIKVRDDAPAQAVIHNSATIVFDMNDPITTDPAWWNTVAGLAEVDFGGVEGMANVTLVVGMPYGELPEPAARDGYTFGGWWTEPEGTGTRITPEMIVPENGGTLYAHWIADGYLSAPQSDEAVQATTSYQGFAYDEEGTMRGLVTLTAKETKGKWSLTAKATMQGAAVSFSAKAWSGETGDMVVNGKSGEVLSLRVERDRFWGMVSGGKIGGTLYVDGARNSFADKKDAAAQARLNAVRGYYTVALVERVAQDDGGEILQPAGYLSLTVGNLGAVKVAGKLADGTAVSGSMKLLEGLNAEGWLAVALFKPLYSKKGFVGGLLWLDPAGKALRVDTGAGWYVDWVSENPKKALFAYALDVCGGWFGDGKTGVPLAPGYAFYAMVPEALPAPVAGLDGGWMEAAFPWELPVTVAGTKLTMPKAVAPKKTGTGAEMQYDYSGENPSAAKVSYTAKTGLFKGTFKLYYDGVDGRGALKHKAVGVSYTGVMTPVRDEAFAELPVGLGVGTATVNKKKEAIPVFLVR